MNTRMIRVLMGALCSLSLALSAAAPAAERPLPKPGTETRAWIELQKKQPATTTPDAPAMPGEVADKVYQRYVDSFAHPLPETFTRESFSTGSGSGGK